MTTEERIANATAKAEAMAATAEIRRGDDGDWLVLSSTGNVVYHTTVDTCTCPAGSFNQPCWHSAAIKRMVAGELAAAIAPKSPTCRECGKQYQTALRDIGLCALCALN